MENNNTTQTVAGVLKSGKSRRGFASMDKERHKMVSSKGGKAIRANYASRNQNTASESTTPPVN